MEPYRSDPDLANALTALRPTPRQEFAAELDGRVEAGFSARQGEQRPAPLLGWLRARSPRQLLVPAGALGALAIIVATAAIALSEGNGSPSSNSLATGAPETVAPTPPSAQRSAEHGTEAGRNAPSRPAKAEPPTQSTGIEYDPDAPSSGLASAGPGAGSAAGASAPAGSGPYAAKAANRDVERSASMVLATPPDQLGDAAKQVFDVVHANDGIVLSSSTQVNRGGRSVARFDLLIPSARLSDALASFSDVAEVRARHDATADVTAPTVGLGERLRDSRARIDGLLEELAGAETSAERETAEAELAAERRHAATLRSRLSALQRRTHLSPVSLRIEGDADAASGGSWSFGDALDDAGQLLAIAAGVALVGLAVLVPIGLLAALAWLLAGRYRRRNRERALE